LFLSFSLILLYLSLKYNNNLNFTIYFISSFKNSLNISNILGNYITKEAILPEIISRFIEIIGNNSIYIRGFFAFFFLYNIIIRN